MEFLEILGAITLGSYVAHVAANLTMIAYIARKRGASQRKQVEKLADMLRRQEEKGAFGDK